MRIIVDSNRVLAALIKDSTTREILFDKNFEFLAPDFILQEIEKHKGRAMEASGLSDHNFEVILMLIFERINIMPKSEYNEFLEQPNVKDEKDVAYVAACLASNAEAIWTHDPHFNEQKKVKIFTNIDMLRISGKNIN